MPVGPSTLRIVHYPDPVLRRRARPVTEPAPEVRAVALRMLELMKEAEGIGLAAPQVGVPWRLFVAHVPPGENRSLESTPPTAMASPVVFINPVLSEPGGLIEAYEEGCLSLPEITGDVMRPMEITVSATDLEGRAFSMRGAGLLARCWQHEVDHLDGVLIIDRMTQLSRLRARAAVRGLEKGM
ncbi:MAG: peptide deformylase [Phycisphaerales bacterium]